MLRQTIWAASTGPGLTDKPYGNGSMKSFAAANDHKRIVYLQFTNPAAYPPLQHSTRVLADDGFDVLVLGARAWGTDTLRFPEHPGITVRQWQPRATGALQKLNYIAFVAWAVMRTIAHRPSWIYASDNLACLPALLLRRLMRCRILYHEHDWPSEPGTGGLARRWLGRLRAELAQQADLCVLPQEERAKDFRRATGRTGPIVCVWNCPRRDEAAPPSEARGGLPLAFYYHGSITPDRLPLNVLDALAQSSSDATLTIAGYETAGSRGYVKALIDHAARLGLAERVSILGPVVTRAGLFEAARKADVGLALLPMQSADINMTHMTGASNKPFDYMACGLFLLVSDLPGWRLMFVDRGHALACDPRSTESLARAMRWCCEHAGDVREKSGEARDRIRSEWNYERQFAPVLAYLSGALAEQRDTQSP